MVVSTLTAARTKRDAAAAAADESSPRPSSRSSWFRSDKLNPAHGTWDDLAVDRADTTESLISPPKQVVVVPAPQNKSNKSEIIDFVPLSPIDLTLTAPTAAPKPSTLTTTPPHPPRTFVPRKPSLLGSLRRKSQPVRETISKPAPKIDMELVFEGGLDVDLDFKPEARS